MALPRQRFHSRGERVRHGAPVEQVAGQEMIGEVQAGVWAESYGRRAPTSAARRYTGHQSQTKGGR